MSNHDGKHRSYGYDYGMNRNQPTYNQGKNYLAHQNSQAYDGYQSHRNPVHSNIHNKPQSAKIEDDSYDNYDDDNDIDWASIPLPGDANTDSAPTTQTQTQNAMGNPYYGQTKPMNSKNQSTSLHKMNSYSRPSNNTNMNTNNHISTPSVGPVAVHTRLPGNSHSNANLSQGNNSQAQPQMSNGSVSSTEIELKQKIEKLEDTLTTKNSDLFDLESTLATIEAEASSRIKEAEVEAKNKMRAAQEELRRMKQEVNSKQFSLAKMRKRQKKEHVPPPSRSKFQPTFVQGRGERLATHFLLHYKTSTQDPLVDDTDTRARINSDDMQGDGVSGDTFQRSSFNSTSNVNPFTGKTVSTSDETPTLPRKRNEGESKDKSHLNPMSVQDWNDLRDNDDKIRAILMSMAITSKYKYWKPSDGEKNAPICGIQELTKELLCILVVKFPFNNSSIFKHNYDRNNLHQKESYDNDEEMLVDDIDPLDEKVDKIEYIPWRSVERILSVIHEICSHSAEARSCIRQWLCDVQIQEKESVEPSSRLDQSSSRIRGLSSKRNKALVGEVTTDMKELLSEGGFEQQLPREQSKINWESWHKKLICSRFMEIITSLIIGKWEKISSNCQDLRFSIQMKCITLLLLLLKDSPLNYHTSDESSDSVMKSKIWSIVFGFLIASDKKDSDIITRGEIDTGQTHIYKDVISILEKSTAGSDLVGRRHYLLRGKKKDNGSVQNVDEKERTEIDEEEGMSADQDYINIDPILLFSPTESGLEFETLAIKASIIQLLEHLFRSSRDIRNSLFGKTPSSQNPYFREDVSGMRRIVSCFLDELQGFSLPRIKAYSVSLVNGEPEDILIRSVTVLCASMTQFITLISQCKIGFDLIRLQMKVGTGDTGHSESGLALLVDLLECSVRIIIQSSRRKDIGKQGEASYKLKAIVVNIVSFFHLAISHIAEQAAANKGRNSVESLYLFMFVAANRTNELCSSCKMILDHQADLESYRFGTITLNQARLILQELNEE